MILHPPPLSRIRRAMPAILMIILPCIPGVAAAPAACDVQESSHTLIIHSYGPDMDRVRTVTEGHVRVFPEEDPGTVFYSEYMDGKIASDHCIMKNLAAVYRHKYASIFIDLIFVFDDDAYAFIHEYGDIWVRRPF